MILKQFTTECQNVITYPTDKAHINSDKSNYYHQNALFNATDIMCLIFQFSIDLDSTGTYVGELSNCSFVCSQWLYHSFNPNSIYYLNLRSLADATAKCMKYNNIDSNVTRTWQRLWTVKKIHFDFKKIDNNYGMKYHLEKIPNLLFNKISTLRNVLILKWNIWQHSS